ncbi:MAG: DUF1553 domain-containing protein, partial [Verrucomicrobiota bacterium]
LEFDHLQSRGGATFTRLDDASILAGGRNPAQDVYTLKARLPHTVQALRIETLTHESLPKNGPGRAGNGNFVLAELELETQGKTSNIVSARADHSQRGYDVKDAFDGHVKSGWAINVSRGNMNVNRTAIFALKAPIEQDLQIRITTYDQGSGYNIGRFRMSVSEETPPDLDARLGELETRKRHLESERKKLNNSTPKTLVMRERAQPRKSFVQLRGDFLDPGPDVSPGGISVLHPMKIEDGRRRTRLDLAHWLTDPENPLTPRVQVNRMWQQLFGVGLVETENDFGYQGALPSHPELLDHLSIEFVEQGWSMKELYRNIVLSSTYRQASIYRGDLNRLDPRNKKLARQNRFRVEGEVIRDLGLAAGGLLSPKMGGPSVFPPIPPNVIGTSSAGHRWPESPGQDRYRRGIYTTIYRANVYPALSVFDGPDRDNACTRRSRSNTPIQALTMANEAAFVEMAKAFGQRILEADNSERIRHAMLIAFAREPSGPESETLAAFQQDRLRFYQSNPDAARALTDEDSPEWASWIAVARVIMNLDEF